MELLNGRPENPEGRLPRELRVYDFLDRAGIEYKRVDHPENAAMTMEACKSVDEILGTAMCKNLFLTNRQQTVFYLLLMPGEKPFKTKELSSQINSARLSFATPEHMLMFLDIEPGAVSLMGLMNDTEKRVNLLIDEDLLKEEFLGCHPCVNTASLRMKTADAFGPFLKATGHSFTTVHLEGY